MVLGDTIIQTLLDEAQVFIDYSTITSEDELLIELSQIVVVLANSIKLFKNYECLSQITKLDIKNFISHTKNQYILDKAENLIGVAQILAENLDKELVKLNKSLSALVDVKKVNQPKNDTFYTV